MDATGAIFSVTLNESGTEVTHANNLSNHSFTEQEKIWAVRGLNGELQEDANWINLQLYLTPRKEVKDFSALFQIPYTTLSRWNLRYKKGKVIKSSTGGNDFYVTDTVLKEVYDTIKGGKRPRTHELKQMLYDAKKEHLRSNGASLMDIERVEAPAEQHARRVFDNKDFGKGIALRSPQIIDAGRERALSCLRLLTMWVTFFMAVFGMLPACKKWNSDQSMVGVMPEGARLKVWIAKEEDDTEARKKNGRLVVTSKKAKKGNMTFVKFTILGNGEGVLGDLVCYVAIDNMSDEDFLACWVPGLCHTNNLGGGGWILFMKKRTGNVKSHRWLHLQYFVPTIAKGDALYTHPSFIGLKAALQIDGEAPILQVAMEPEVQKAYHDAVITGAKGPPNCTGRDQLMDVAPLFMNTHAG